ncbi:MAG: helix-turn-helix transcriptional regulator [Lachnospiraceae bacterium]|nr:helix-turn-helix transcriptional regulator [Lachnospiraceae bacterium]
MNDTFERQLKKGVLDMLVLQLLSEQPRYGYQLIQELKQRSDGTFSLKDGTLYPILYRLEDSAWVESKWSAAEGRQVPRKYYEITKDGISALKDMRESMDRIKDGIAQIMKGGDQYDS